MFKSIERIINEAFNRKFDSKSLTEADKVQVTAPTFANKESDFSIKSMIKSKQDEVEAQRKADAEAKRKEELRQKYGKVLDNAKEVLATSSVPHEALQVLFDELVPASGPADTVAGELVRAMMKILYRDYNDGDVFYEGYGIETCGPAVSYIIDNIDGMFDKFDNIAKAQLEDDRYTNAINDIAKDIVEYIINNPETLETPRTREMFDYNYDWIYRDWEPKYEFDIYLDYPDLDEHLDAGHIDYNDVYDFIDECVSYGGSAFEGAEVHRYGYDGFVVENLKSEGFEELDRYFGLWMQRWIEDLNEEYPFVDEDEEFEESCKSRKKKKPVKESSEDKIEVYQQKVDYALDKFGRVGGKLYDELDENGLYLDVDNAVKCKSRKTIKEDLSNATLADFFEMNGYADVDVYDKDWDYGTAIVWEGEKPSDNYDEFVDWVVKNTKYVRRVDDITAVADFSDLINKHWSAFGIFTENNNRDEYKMSEYKDKDDKIEVALMTLVSMLEGNYSDNDYDDFLKLIETL